MKKYNFFYILALSMAMVACDPKEDRDNLPQPSIQRSDVKFSITQEQGHDNIVMLDGLTQGNFTHFWEFSGGFSKKQKDTITFPFAGTYMIRYSVYTSGGPLGDSAEINVTENDPYYFSNPMWNLLTDGQEGKTWVWATDVPGGFCHGNGTGDALTPQWWQNGLAYLTSEKVQNDEMTFDLNGARNYTLTHNGASKKASFELDTLNKTVKITGSDISLGSKITYTVAKLTENELTLVEQGDGWRNLWLFKRKGYSF